MVMMMMNVVVDGVRSDAISVSSLLGVNDKSGGLSTGTSSLVAATAEATKEFRQQQNQYGQVREMLIRSMLNLTMGMAPSIQLQASALATLTASTNQLTRSASVSDGRLKDDHARH
jgi:predicted MarR family transcription regulator